jgi:single-stranded DNA-binding protein
MRYGFSQHLIIGRIGHVEQSGPGGVRRVRLTVAAKLFPPRRSDGPDVAWYDMALWGRNAETFLRMNFRPGDPVGVRASTLEAHPWQDGEGCWRASLKGNADCFWDLRNPMRPGHGPSSRPVPGDRSGSPYPTDAELAAGGWAPLSFSAFEDWAFRDAESPAADHDPDFGAAPDGTPAPDAWPDQGHGRSQVPRPGPGRSQTHGPDQGHGPGQSQSQIPGHGHGQGQIPGHGPPPGYSRPRFC